MMVEILFVDMVIMILQWIYIISFRALIKGMSF